MRVDRNRVDAPGRAAPPERGLGPRGVVLLVLIALLLPALYRPTFSGKLPFRADSAGALAAPHPEYVFIGNSMLDTRIDPRVLSSRLGEGCCEILWTGGAESAWQHQALKNIALASDRLPRVVFIFFRDAYLTRANFRTSGQYGWKIERLSHESEPELAAAMHASRTWQEKLEYGLGLIYPIQKRRDNAANVLTALAAKAASVGEHPAVPISSQLNALFTLDKMRAGDTADDAAGAPADGEILNFEAQLPRSLLPSMLNLARQSGVRLVFVRVQRRPTVSGPPEQSAAMIRYIGSLRRYVEANHADFYDFTGDPQLTLDRYLDGDHIRPTWKAQSTELFLQRLSGYFQ